MCIFNRQLAIIYIRTYAYNNDDDELPVIKKPTNNNNNKKMQDYRMTDRFN